MKLIRELHRGMRGPDCRAMKRALKKAGFGRGIVISNSFGKAAYRDLRLFQQKHGLHVDGVLGPQTFAKLLPFVDAYGLKLFRKAPVMTPEEIAFAKLLAAMHLMAAHTPGYLLGGEHGIPLEKINPYHPTDCSSSCSYVLWKAGLLHGARARVSWEFDDWGWEGTGRLFTVHCNSEHVWIQLNPIKSGGYWRFDTSPHGDGGRGPRLRRLPRFTTTFLHRHWKGM